MRLGVIFPQTEIGSDPAVIKTFGQTVEGLGFDYLLAYEHVLGVDPARYDGGRGYTYTAEHAFHEPFVLFGYLAGVTTRLTFMTGILILPQRQAALVAKQAASLDVLSGGRLRLGIGVGWNRTEAEALGSDFSTRGERIEEQIALLNALWAAPVVEFEGQDHHIPHLGINPLPVQRPIPLWFGGMADPVLRRMARWGAGWIVPAMPPERGRPSVEQLRRYLADEGRELEDFGLEVHINLSHLPRAEWHGFVMGWRELGATDLSFNTMNSDLASADAHLDALRDFKAFASDLAG